MNCQNNFIVLFTFSLNSILASAGRGPEKIEAKVGCPKECTCSMAPLRAAPFVLSWMASWGEADLPDARASDVLDHEPMVLSKTASEAGINVEVAGLHATCSLYQSANFTNLISQLSTETLVLSILQSPGSNLTIIDESDLSKLSSLKALHLQGYAHEKGTQDPEPRNVGEMFSHVRMMEEHLSKEHEITKDLRLALVENALNPLKNLELLDLRYVKLLASEEAHRLRRYSTEPISSTTLLALPLKQFFSLAKNVHSFRVPSHLKHHFNTYDDAVLKPISSEEMPTPNKVKSLFQIRELAYPNTKSRKGFSNIPLYDTIRQLNNEHVNKQKTKSSYIVPYSVYKSEKNLDLSPFKSLKLLKYLKVAHGRLDKIGPQLLKGLDSLHTLTLEHNNIKLIPKDLFKPTGNLRHLSLAHNQVLMISSDNLKYLSGIQTLDLDYNQLSILGPASFPYLPQLKALRIYENPLTHLLPDTFASLNSTENIYLGSTNIPMDIHENSFRFLSNVKDIELRNVSLKNLKKSLLAGMPGIERLSIHGVILRIEYDAFSVTPVIKYLNISHCRLSYLSVDSFYGLQNLETLDLSKNELTSISPGTFDYLSNLQELYLHDNLLSTLPLGIFVPLNSKLIQLHNNPWHCTCDLLQLKPTTTNKVKRKGHTVCNWTDKTQTGCHKTKDRFIYDARVAPLCQVPLEFAGSDVYHTALRHLECDEHHWNPSLVVIGKGQDPGLPWNTPSTLEQKSEGEELYGTVTQRMESRIVGEWLPLLAYTPQPFESEDLLDIAEKEGLEEVKDEPRVLNDTVAVHDKPGIEPNQSKDILYHHGQNDEPQRTTTTNLSSRFYTSSTLGHSRPRNLGLAEMIIKKNILRRKQKKSKKLEMMYMEKNPFGFLKTRTGFLKNKKLFTLTKNKKVKTGDRLEKDESHLSNKIVISNGKLIRL